ncbi:putative ribonuclease H-like domain-containing protein [Tanacetum coccineum]
MLADSKLPTTFWAEAVSTACYVQNRVLVVKPHNKTPYELFRGFKPALSFMRPFGCHVTILNTLDNLGKFDGKSDEVAVGTISNESAGTQGELNAGTSTQKEEINQDCILMPIWKDASYFDSPSKDVGNGEPKSATDDQKQVEDGPHNESDEKDNPEVNTSCFKLNTVVPSVSTASSHDQDSPKYMFNLGASHTLETTHVEFFSDEDEPEVDLGNITNSYTVPTTPNTRIHKDHTIKNVIRDMKSSIQKRRMTKSTFKQGFLSAVYEQKMHDTLNTYLYGCFLSQIEPTSIAKALSDSSWVEAIQEELLEFKLQQVWKLVDLPNGKKAIRTKCVIRNKKDERGIVIRNKAKLVAQGHRQEEGINYEEVFAHVSRIDAIRLFLAYASFMGFLVYQMDVKSAFLYGTIKEEVYVTQPPGFKDPDHPNKVYKVVKALYGLHQAPRAWSMLMTLSLASYKQRSCVCIEKLMKDKFQMSSMGELTFFLGLQVTQKEDGIFISQDKYVAEILKKFNYTDVKSASTLVDLEKPLVKDGDADDVDVHLYRSMIGSLMYLTASRPDIMFAVCACARFQVTPKTSHLLAIKRIFRYLKGKPTLGLWYSRDSPFELVAYTDNDYAGATQDRKSTTGGCQFLGNRLISWQCKKQTVVATSTTEAEYVAAASCCGQVLWIQNQLLDYGYNFMNTVINIDNNSTIYIIENPAQHIKTKHIKLRHHFIRDCNAKKLIQMVKNHTDHNVADLLTKDDAGRHVKRGRDTKIPQSSGPPVKVGDEAVHKELGDRMERAATTASSLEAEQDSAAARTTDDGEVEITASIDGQVKTITEASLRMHLMLEDSDGITSLPITKIFEQLALMCPCAMYITRRFFVTLFNTLKENLCNMKRKDLREIVQEGHGGRTAVTQEENNPDDSVPTPSNDPPLSGEDSMQLSELMLLCTNLQKQVLDLEKAKDAQGKEIADLKKRVQRMDADIFDIDDIHGDEVNVDMPVGDNQEHSAKEKEVDTSVEDSAAPTTINEITLAQTHIQIKAAKPKVVTTAATITTTRPKARGVVDTRSHRLEKQKNRLSRKKLLGMEKKAGKEQQQESSKRQRMEDDKETDEHEEVEEVEEDDEVELKKHLVIVKDDEIAIYAITTCTQTPEIDASSIGQRRLETLLKSTIPISTSNEIDYDKLIEAQQVSIAMTISAKEVGEKENITIVKKAVLANEVEQMVKGDEENPVEVCQENPGTRLEPRSHKECPMENRNDVDNDDQHTVDALIKMKKMGSSEIRDGEKHTPIPTPSRSPRTNLSSESSAFRDAIRSHKSVDPDMWKVHKAKYEKSSAPSESCRYNIFHKRDHDDHLDDNAPREGEKGTKKQKTSGKSKSAKDSSSSKQPVKDYQKMSFVQQQ